jgi:hypothetical protein
MENAASKRIRHLSEVTRLQSIVETARLSLRNVSLERALIIQHTVAIAELDAELEPSDDPDSGSAK